MPGVFSMSRRRDIIRVAVGRYTDGATWALGMAWHVAIGPRGRETPMDGQRFDDIARSLGHGASRRRVLAGFAGAALGLIGLGRTQTRAGAAEIDWTGRYCGGLGGFPCPNGYTCIDDPNDACDPFAGGADCGGICQRINLDPLPTSCAAVLCMEGTHCCEACGTVNCVPNDVPCPLALCAGDECNGVFCGPDEYCCNYSCSICAPVGGACIDLYCGGGGETCGDTVCGEGEYCCNPSCGTCAPLDGFCTMIACID